MKLEDGRRWYIADLNHYNEDYLKDIILDLKEKLDVKK